MKELKFNGFTPATIQFFNDIKENNYKEWFEENKPIYEKEVVAPFKALVTALSPVMHSVDPDFELRPHRAISRIYRDVRFSKNKDPYKICMWITFQIPVSRDIWMDYPGYYLDINGENYTIGMGLFMPKKKTMDSFREEIGYDAQEFQRVTEETVFGRNFEVQGDMYKRMLPSNLPEYFQQWIQRKGVYVSKTRPIGEELFSPDFANLVSEDFKSLKWLYKFMKECSLG